MNSFALYTTNYNGREYDFVPTRNARIAIEDLSLNAFDGISNPEIFGAMMGQGNIDKDLRTAKELLQKAKDEENQELIDHYTEIVKELENKVNGIFSKILPSIKEMTIAQRKSEDQYEIAKILLLNYKGNGEMSASLADEILEDMEMQLGSEAYEEKLLEITDMVFTQIKKIQDHKEKIFKKNKADTGKVLPMS